MCQHQADEDEGSSKPANNHFHKDIFLSSVKAARHQRPDDHAVERADKRIAGQRTSPGRTADEFVIGKAQAATDDNPNNNA